MLKSAREKAELLLDKWNDIRKKQKRKEYGEPSTVKTGTPSAGSITTYNNSNHFTSSGDQSNIIVSGNYSGKLKHCITRPSASNLIMIQLDNSRKRSIDSVDPSKVAKQDEVDALFNSVISSDDTEDAPRITFVKDISSAHLKVPITHWFVEELNVSLKFHEYQELVKERIEGQGIILETHAYEILAMSSILLLKQNQYSSSMLRHFSQQNLNKIQDAHISSQLKESTIVLDENLFTDIRAIVKTLQKKHDRLAAINALSTLDIKSNHQEKIAMMMMLLVLKLPLSTIESKSGEINLCTNYLDPVLCSILNDDHDERLLQWPNTKVEDSKSKRPDAVVFSMLQNQYDTGVCYGEAKLEEAKKTPNMLVQDLLRIALFSKETIDTKKLSSCLSFQAVGQHVVFYITSLQNDGLYIMSQLADINCPASIDDLLNFINCFDDLLAVMAAMDSISVDNDDRKKTYRRRSFDSPQFRAFLQKKRHDINGERSYLKF
ncbi:hypothetical protein MBANPS3_010962 [Mucor bainieri]